MSLAAGTRLGPYEILAPLGAGGMGEVYKARDTRLDRTVAIKVLPEHLSQKPQLRERFEREARAVSSLNHPHICTLHDVGQQDGIDYLVMEYLEGETLAHRLHNGALPVDKALRYAVEIAGALDQAHRKGVIHRDLKPANIMLTKAGAKVMDFGLAKIHAMETPAGLTQATNTLTEEGVILGTMQYMAPEQLEAKEADARTDIFAFGAVLYEMVTGRKAFEGQSRASLIAAIMQNEPAPIATLQPLTPPALDDVVKRCLAKVPDERFQTAADLAWALNRGVPAPAESVRPVSRWAWIVAGGFALATLALAVAYFRRNDPHAPVARFAVAPPFKSEVVDLAVSPDGSRIAMGNGDSALWLRSIDSLTVQKVPGTEGAARPFWSADGHSIGFFSGTSLKRVDLNGGQASVQMVVPVTFWSWGSWNSEGVILFTPEQTGGGLHRVPASGGVPEVVTKLNLSKQEVAHRYPQFLPDGRRFLYWVWSANPENTGIYVGSLDPRERLPEGPLVRTWREARFAEPEYLLFFQGSRLAAQRFDTKGLRLTGEPHFLADPAAIDAIATGRASLSTSREGVLAYQQAAAFPGNKIVWRDRAGKAIRTIEAPPRSLSPALDRNGRNLVICTEDENALEELWLIDLERGITSRLTATHASNLAPTWSPDGRRIAFRSNRAGTHDLYVKEANGIGHEELLLKSPHGKVVTDWSRDGRFLVYVELDPKTGADIWLLPLDGDRKPFPFLKTEFFEVNGVLSPLPGNDGHSWMAYQSDETGRQEVYLRPFLPGAPGGPAGAKVRVSTAGGLSPMWRADGRELYFDRGGTLMAVDVKLGAAAEVGAEHRLFDLPPGHEVGYASFGDGKRFLFIEPAGEPPQAKINVVLTWQAELKQ